MDAHNILILGGIVFEVIVFGAMIFLMYNINKRDNFQLERAINEINTIGEKVHLKFTLMDDKEYEFDFFNPVAYITPAKEFRIHDRKGLTFAIPVNCLKNIQVRD